MKESGLRVCVDREDFRIGDVSVFSMEQGVESSRKILLVLTPNWTRSDWANFEALIEISDDPLNRSRRVMPLMVEKCEPPRRIKILNYADFTLREEWDNQFKRLIRDIKDERDLPIAIEVASLSTPFKLPQKDDPNFTGRDDELRRLEDLLLKREGLKICSIVGLAGTGGIGKSALACHFAELHREDFPRALSAFA